ncbi:MAG TPA: ribokinase [Acidimicrobiia bacterium]|nr:ribokinase [Acidimicrobiia bacterium]
MPHVTVVGSVNLDLVATAPALPRPGETITGAVFERHPGGKGGNQALAARRMGADVRLVACIGADAEGERATSLLAAAGVDLGGCRIAPDEHTGVALIVVGPGGENQIVVAPGANRSLERRDIGHGVTDVTVCQLEIPIDVVITAVEEAAFSILNCAPARELPPDVFERCDVVVVNETEASFYGDALARAKLVVKTLGAAGAVASREGTEIVRMPALDVAAVDTVGAGDTFVGTLAAEMASGASLEDALRLATAAGSVATTRPGAQPAIPTRQEVRAAMEAGGP